MKFIFSKIGSELFDYLLVNARIGQKHPKPLSPCDPIPRGVSVLLRNISIFVMLAVNCYPTCRATLQSQASQNSEGALHPFWSSVSSVGKKPVKSYADTRAVGQKPYGKPYGQSGPAEKEKCGNSA
jgi:hypothetical protein